MKKNIRDVWLLFTTFRIVGFNVRCFGKDYPKLNKA